MNLLGFLLMGIDKRRAKKHRWRIPERVLLLTGAFGGCLGGLLGMLTFHHKTKKAAFVICMPLFVVAHGIIAYLIVF